MSNKAIQRKRMITYFVKATQEIINTEGISGITIRKVADLAGYNSATLYNYFESLDHLIYFTSLSYLEDYIRDVQINIPTSSNALEQYVYVWEKFAIYAFKNPEFFHIIFFSTMGHQYEEYYSLYDEIFNAHISQDQKNVSKMLREKNIYNRSKILMDACIKQDFINKEEGRIVDEITVLSFEGILNKVRMNFFSEEEALEKFKTYLKYLLDHSLIKTNL